MPPGAPGFIPCFALKLLLLVSRVESCLPVNKSSLSRWLGSLSRRGSRLQSLLSLCFGRIRTYDDGDAITVLPITLPAKFAEPIILAGSLTSTSGRGTFKGMAGAENSMRSPAQAVGANKAHTPPPIKTAKAATELEQRTSITSRSVLYAKTPATSTFSVIFFSWRVRGKTRLDNILRRHNVL